MSGEPGPRGAIRPPSPDEVRVGRPSCARPSPATTVSTTCSGRAGDPGPRSTTACSRSSCPWRPRISRARRSRIRPRNGSGAPRSRGSPRSSTRCPCSPSPMPSTSRESPTSTGACASGSSSGKGRRSSTSPRPSSTALRSACGTRAGGSRWRQRAGDGTRGRGHHRERAHHPFHSAAGSRGIGFPESLEVRGEVYLPLERFERLNEEQRAREESASS